MTRRFEYKLFADFSQFYLQDESAEDDPDISWTPEATDRLLAVEPGIVRVGTVRTAIVPVTVEITEGEPDDDVNAWDQVNECTIEVPSGRLVIAGCTDDFPDAARIEVLPGSYRARVYYGNLGSRSDDGRDGNDRYKVVLWSAAPEPLQILKQSRERYPLYWP